MQSYFEEVGGSRPRLHQLLCCAFEPDFHVLDTLSFLLFCFFGRKCWPVGCGRPSEVNGDLCQMNKACPFSAQPENLAEGMGHSVMVLSLIFESVVDE